MSRFEAPPGIVTNGLVLNLDAGDPDSYTRSQPPYVEVLVVAGGGGGGIEHGGGGGGAGGLIYNSAYQLINAVALTVTVGAGGTSGGSIPSNGSNSVFGSLTAIGGGRGGSESSPQDGSNGGSGGGGSGFSTATAGGTGTAGQGFNGGRGAYPDTGGVYGSGGGGGGAGAPGTDGKEGFDIAGGAGIGGNGQAYSISGTSTYYAGGGGGGLWSSTEGGGGDGGLGGGGTGGSGGDTQPTAGTSNTGGGGGGSKGSGGAARIGGAGGSGIVIVRYPGLPAATGGTITYLNGYTIHTFTSSGTFTPNLWNDVSGNNNSGSLVNGVGFNSYQNSGFLTFDGTDDVVDVVGNFGTYANYTICYWAVRDAENRMPVASRIGAPFYWFGDNSWAYTHGGVVGELYYSKNVSIPLGSWGHLCVVYNGSNVSIYRQGIYQDQQATTGTANWSQGLKIGNWDGGAGYAWLGDIATVQFYTRALSAAEITQNYNAQKARFGL
jgi:hypothetical protein